MRIYNFSAGPAVLPADVLAQARDEMLDWHGSGMSVMEMSHRGKEFISIAENAEKDLRELLAVPANYKVLFLQGGATMQFPRSAEPAAGKGKADYIHSGVGQEGHRRGQEILHREHRCQQEDKASPTRPNNQGKLDPEAAYVHYTGMRPSAGWSFNGYPNRRGASGLRPVLQPLSRSLDVSQFGLIYAGAQKNIGPAGLTIVIVREDLVGQARPGTPSCWTTSSGR